MIFAWTVAEVYKLVLPRTLANCLDSKQALNFHVWNKMSSWQMFAFFSKMTCRHHRMWHYLWRQLMSPTSSRWKNTYSIISSGFASPIMTLSRSYSALRSAVSVKLIASKYRRAISFTSGSIFDYWPVRVPSWDLRLWLSNVGAAHYKKWPCP